MYITTAHEFILCDMLYDTRLNFVICNSILLFQTFHVHVRCMYMYTAVYLSLLRIGMRHGKAFSTLLCFIRAIFIYAKFMFKRRDPKRLRMQYSLWGFRLTYDRGHCMQPALYLGHSLR